MFRALSAALVVSLAACSRAPAARPPSILFVSLDTLAARHTSLHGYARHTTPNLAALAAEAIVFERCLANAPWTSPSYASQFTGLLPESSWSAPQSSSRAWRGSYRTSGWRFFISEVVR